MGYVLYGDIGSGSAVVEMALAEAGETAEWRDVPLEGDHHLRPEYLAVNPMGRMPTLVLPDGTVMTESLAILVALAERHPVLLPPPGSAERARALRWMTLAAAEFYPHVTRADYPERFGPDPAAIRARAVEMGREVWQVVEAHAGLRGEGPEPFLLGATFSVADIYLAVLSRWMGGRQWVPANLPRLEALAQAVAVRPALAPLWRRHRLAA
jgi:GST-like protein